MPPGSPAALQPGTTPSAGGFTAKSLCPSLVVKSAPISLIGVLALYSHIAHAAPPLATINNPASQAGWLRPILYGIAGLIAFLGLRAALYLIRTGFGRNSNRTRNGNIPVTSVGHFVEDAEKLHIDPLIARETFQHLMGLLPAETSVAIHDELRESLHLSEGQIDSLLLALPRLCDRSTMSVSAIPILSVYDLLQHIQSLPKSGSGQFHLRSVPEAQAATTSLASPLADLQNASPRDSRFRTRAHFSEVKRRASDYSGPYRRATDRRPEENYTGPLRRASDRKDADGTSPDPRPDLRNGDRRSSERRAVVSQDNSEPARQHRAVSADTSLLNQCLSAPAGKASSDSAHDRLSTPASHESITIPAAPLQHH